MKCPNCGNHLEEVRKDAVYIDACRNCKGVWLDKGELETLLFLTMPHQENRHDNKYREHKPVQKHHKQNSYLKVLKEIFD